MLKFGNKEFRNLQEQVLKNMKDIANIKSSGLVLDEFGIKVVGQESSVANMPSVADYKLTNPDWAYGDAYAIGTEAPYTLYILTREDANHTDDYWFNIGRFPEPGPQGPKGDTGDTGPQGQTGNPGADGAAAGFGAVTATAVTLEPSEEATVSVVASGPNTEKSFAFTFGIPKGEAGESGTDAVWGNITGSLSNQTDLVSALQAKQNLLVSGTNIKTINNESILGSGNIVIQGGSGNVNDVEVNGVSVVDAQGVAEVIVPTKTSDLTNNSGFITSSALSGYATQSYVQSYHDSTKQDVISDLSTIRSGAALGATAVQPAAIADMATETWVGQQGYLTSVSWSDVSGKPTFATVATSGSYNDLSNKPTIPEFTEIILSGTGQYGTLTAEQLAQLNADPTKITISRGNSSNSIGYYRLSLDNNVDYNGPYYLFEKLRYNEQNSETSSMFIKINKTTGQWQLTATILANKDFVTSNYVTSSVLTTTYAKLAGGIISLSPQQFTGYHKFAEVLNAEKGVVVNHTTYKDAQIAIKNTSTSPSINATIEIPTKSGTLALTSDIPTNVSDLTNDSGFITGITSSDVTTALGYTPGTSNFSGAYADLTGKPTIPTKTSDLTNDSGFITNSALSDYVDLTTSQSISGRKTFNSGISIGYSGNVCGHIEGDNTTELIIKSATTLSKPNNAQVYLTSVASGNKPIVAVLANIEPYNDNDTDLGRTNRKWKDLYLAGNLTDGTNSIAIANIADKSNSETWTFTLADGTTTTKTIVLG